MNSDKEYPFSHNIKVACVLLFSSLVSLLITSLPLFVIQYLSFDVALFVMFAIECVFVSLLYVVYLRKHPQYTLLPSVNSTSIKKTLIVFVLIMLIQLMVFTAEVHQDLKNQVQMDFSSLIALVFLIPFYEEIIYRGCWFGFLSSIFKKSTVVPAILTSIIFCLVHTQYNSIAAQFVLFTLSLMIMYIRIITKSLFYPILLHAGMNAFVVLLNVKAVWK